MCIRDRADEWSVFRLRSTLAALALVVCLSAATGSAIAFAGVPGTSAQPVARIATGHRKSARRHRRGTRSATHCARPSSFHTSGGHVPRKHHPTRCAEHGSRKHRRGHNSKPRKRTGHHAKRHASRDVKPADANNCPGSDLTPTPQDIEAVRTATLCLIDQERTNHGEATLQPNAHLQQSAQAHSQSMVSEDYFEHVSPQGDTPLSRMIAAGYIYSSHVGYEVGENIGWGTLSLSTPRAIVAAWMASPGHRANILDAHFRDTAIGVSPNVPASLGHGQAGGMYTQDFGVIITG
jgi:uncharacterized protein YkwD